MEVEGWGECTALPEPTYSSEYTTGAVEVSERYIVPALVGAGNCRAADVAATLSFLKGHRMAKAAFEAAILDAQLRSEGVRMADFLAGVSAGGRPPKEAVVAGVAVGLESSLGPLLDEVEEYASAGYGRVKLKIGPGWDEEPVAAVRRRWPELVLFADANGSYAGLPFAEATARLARLDEYGLACIEQPLGDDDLAGHAHLAATPRDSAVPGRSSDLAGIGSHGDRDGCLLCGERESGTAGRVPGSGQSARPVRGPECARVVRGDGRDRGRPGGQHCPGRAAQLLAAWGPLGLGPVLRAGPDGAARAGPTGGSGCHLVPAPGRPSALKPSRPSPRGGDGGRSGSDAFSDIGRERADAVGAPGRYGASR